MIVLLGGATGRDGIGGATGSSKAHTEKSVEVCGAEVQKGNPPTERKIQRLFRDPAVSTLIKRCNDFGAGGVSVAIGELAPGLDIDLDKVPKKYEGLDGTELAISESQERMAVVLAPAGRGGLPRRRRRAKTSTPPWWPSSRRSPASTMTWRGDRVVSLARSFLDTNGVTQNAKVRDCRRPTRPEELPRRWCPPALAGKSARAGLLARTCPASRSAARRDLAERFDASIGAATVNMPFGGAYQLTPGGGHGREAARAPPATPTTPPP